MGVRGESPVASCQLPVAGCQLLVASIKQDYGVINKSCS
jgi:hypothetical protein